MGTIKNSFKNLFGNRAPQGVTADRFSKLTSQLRPKREKRLELREAELEGQLSHTFTDEMQIEYLKRIANGASPGHTALDLGVTIFTVYKLEKENAAFRRAKEFARQLWFEKIKSRCYELGFVSAGKAGKYYQGGYVASEDLPPSPHYSKMYMALEFPELKLSDGASTTQITNNLIENNLTSNNLNLSTPEGRANSLAQLKELGHSALTVEYKNLIEGRNSIVSELIPTDLNAENEE
jgi:hypothetical protein